MLSSLYMSTDKSKQKCLDPDMHVQKILVVIWLFFGFVELKLKLKMGYQQEHWMLLCTS